MSYADRLIRGAMMLTIFGAMMFQVGSSAFAQEGLTRSQTNAVTSATSHQARQAAHPWVYPRPQWQSGPRSYPPRSSYYYYSPPYAMVPPGWR
jgi:hypothetical protein